MSLKELFYKCDSSSEKLEGYLDNENPQAEVLFILKEPHSENHDEFWFRNVVRNETGYRAGAVKRYYKILGSIACLLTGKSSKDIALKMCVYKSFSI